MATVTHAGVTLTTTAGTKTLVATPAVGDLIVVFTACSAQSTTAVSDNNGSGTYTILPNGTAGTPSNLNCWVRNSLIASATSTTFTATQASSQGGGLSVFRISGITLTGLSAVRTSELVSFQSSGTAPTITMPQAALTTNVMLGAAQNGSVAPILTPPSGWSEGADASYITPSVGLETAFRNSGHTSATVTWGSNSATNSSCFVVEIDTSVPSFMPFPKPYLQLLPQ